MPSTEFDHAYVDADVLRYRCGFACEYTLYYIKGVEEPFRGKTKYKKFIEEHPEYAQTDYYAKEVVEPPSHAIQICKNYISQIESVLKCKSTMILSGPSNFRDEIATIKPYKGNRPDRKPKCFDELTAWMLDNGAVVTDGIEADDLLAIRANEDNSVICTVDKDLLQVPGWHYDFVTDTLRYVDETQGWFNLCVQILAGDSTDNIQGIPGVGVKKAEKMLSGCETKEDMFFVVEMAYEAQYGDGYLHFLNENAALVYILRCQDDKWEYPEEDIDSV